MNEDQEKQLKNVTQELIALQMRVVRDFPIYEKKLLEVEKKLKELSDGVSYGFGEAKGSNKELWNALNKKADKTELPKLNSLEVKVAPKNEEKPSLLSELMKVIINRNKK